MHQKILTVAGPEWQSALAQATVATGIGNTIETQNAADAVIALATRPTAYRALALDAEAGGTWLETLIDLTLGDTERTVPLLILGSNAPIRLPLHDTPTLEWPVDAGSLARALEKASQRNAAPIPHPPPDSLNNIDAIRVRYQPVVRLADLKPTTVEVLARLITKDGQTLGPGAIISAMTSAEHAMTITQMILKLALKERQLGEFDTLDLRIAFNLPLDTMLDPNILTALNTISQAGNIPNEAIRLELTETQPVTDIEQLRGVIGNFTAAGYRLALDDITPGTPNLEALLNLPFRAVKLDRSIVAQAQHYNPKIANPARNFIAKTTHQASQSGRAIIAEGIENTETLSILKSLGVTHGQGYHFARPLPARALKPWLTHWRTEMGV